MATVLTITQALVDAAEAANITITKENGTSIIAGNGISHVETLRGICKTGYKFAKVDGKNDFAFTFTTGGATKYYGTDQSDTQSTIGPWNSALRLTGITFSTVSNRTPVRVLDSSDISDFTESHAKLFVNGVAATSGMSVYTGDVLRAVADDGWKFESQGETFIKLFTSNPTGDTFYFTKDSSALKAGTYTVGTELGFFFVYTVEEVAPPTPVRTLDASDISDFTSNHAKLMVNGVPAVAGMTVYTGDVLQAVADSGWNFNPVGDYNISVDFTDVSGTTIYFNKEDAALTTGSLTVADSLGYFFVTTSEVVVPPTPIRTLDQDDIDVFTGNHSKLYLRGVLAVSGDLIYAGDELSVIADSGWTFVQPAGDGVPNNAISAYWLDSTGYPTYFLRTGADFTRGKIPASAPIGLFVTTVVIVQPEDVKGFNNVYEVTDEQLQLIARKRFVVEEGQPGESSNTVDYGVYILGLIDLPFKIDPAMIVDQQLINLGPLKTDVSASFLNTDTLRLSLGSISVVGTKGNFLDYQDTVIMLHLPYSESVAIEPKYAINETISVEYLISLYDGVAIMNVKSSKTDSVIITQNVDLNISVPFANTQAVPSRNDPSSVKLGGDNGLKTAFIEILRNNAVLERGFFTTPIVDEGQLSAYNGFARIEDIVLKSKATSQEKDLIESQLKNGVYVK